MDQEPKYAKLLSGVSRESPKKGNIERLLPHGITGPLLLCAVITNQGMACAAAITACTFFLFVADAAYHQDLRLNDALRLLRGARV
jgi:hypothetical protein